MKKKLVYFIMAAVILAVSDAGCAKKPSINDTILAKVSNDYITLKELKSRIAKLPAYYQGIVEKNKKRYLDDLIVEMLFYEEAVRRGVDKDRELAEVIKEAKRKIVIAKFIKEEVEDKIEVSEDEARQFYETNKDEFKTPALWRASHILVANENEAKDILNELSKGGSFEELARLHSTDATASRGGDIGFFRSGQLIPDFENACLKLSVGETSGIVHTQFGYHIIKLTDKKEPSAESYEKVKRAIENKLRKKKRSELFDKLVLRLREKYGVRIQEDVFKTLDAAEKEENANEETSKAL